MVLGDMQAPEPGQGQLQPISGTFLKQSGEGKSSHGQDFEKLPSGPPGLEGERARCVTVYQCTGDGQRFDMVVRDLEHDWRIGDRGIWRRHL